MDTSERGFSAIETALHMEPLVERDKALERLWADLSDIPFEDHKGSDMTLAVPWLHFPIGTEREEIWHWFDERHSKGVAYLLNGDAPVQPEAGRHATVCTDAYVVQTRETDGKLWLSVHTAQQIIELFGYRDCSGCDYEVFKSGGFGSLVKLGYDPGKRAEPNYHRFIDPQTGETEFSGYSTEH